LKNFFFNVSFMYLFSIPWYTRSQGKTQVAISDYCATALRKVIIHSVIIK
jgi:hypothetical protein